MVDFNTPEDFHFVKGDDLSKIRLGGDILPLRETSQRALRGLDIAFLIEASQERKSCLMGEYRPRFEFVRNLDRTTNFAGIDWDNPGQGSQITSWVHPSATFPTHVSDDPISFQQAYPDAFLTKGDFDYSHYPYKTPSFSNITAIFNNIQREKRYYKPCITTEDFTRPYNRLVSFVPIPNAEGEIPESPETPLGPTCFFRYMTAAYNGIEYYWDHGECYTTEWELNDTCSIRSSGFNFNRPSSLYVRFCINDDYWDRSSGRTLNKYVWTPVDFTSGETGFSVSAASLNEASRRAISAAGITLVENPGRLEPEGSFAPGQRTEVIVQRLEFSSVCDVPMRTRW